MTFTKETKTHFRQTDLAGVLYFNEINNIFHDAYEDYVEAHLGDPKEWFQNKEWAVPLKKVDTEFHGPLFAFQIYNVELQLVGLGTSSLEFLTKIQQSDRLLATVKSHHVFMNLKTRSSQEIPKHYRKKLEALLAKD